EWYGRYQPLRTHLIGDQPDSFESLHKLSRAVDGFSAWSFCWSPFLLIQQPNSVFAMVLTDLTELLKYQTLLFFGGF
ncbi:MAG: hypothetical protein U9N55_06815, partial [candidate division Zixibacteria bacterium]|nr:hypothetical protein [candidate division Zixibacteria bacterium]